MAQLLIRGLDAGIVERLKQHASDHDRSLEAEARVILADGAARLTARERELELRRLRRAAARLRRRLRGRWTGDSADIIRRVRARR